MTDGIGISAGRAFTESSWNQGFATAYGFSTPLSALHPKQRQILALVEQQPGINIREVAKSIGVYRTAAIHHIRKLASQNRVTCIRQGRHVFHYPPRVNKVERAALPLLRIPSIRAIVESLLENPTVSWDELSARLTLSGRTVRRAILLLQTSGLAVVERRRRPGRNHVVLNSDLRVVVAASASPQAAVPQVLLSRANDEVPVID